MRVNIPYFQVSQDLFKHVLRQAQWGRLFENQSFAVTLHLGRASFSLATPDEVTFVPVKFSSRRLVGPSRDLSPTSVRPLPGSHSFSSFFSSTSRFAKTSVSVGQPRPSSVSSGKSFR